MSDMLELKPCPFCGGGACLGADMNTYPDITCDACGANVSGKGTEGAYAAWNRRADASEVAALVTALRTIVRGKYDGLEVTRLNMTECRLIALLALAPFTEGTDK